MNDISIVTPTIKSWPTQDDWIKAFTAHTPKELVKEIIIVWDAPQTLVGLMEVRHRLKDYNPIIVVNERPIGISRAFNMGAKVASGKYLCFLEDAIYVTPEWLGGLKEALDTKPEFGWVAATQLENPRATFTAMCSLMTKEVFDEVGGFDELLCPFDDADMIMRLRGAGYAFNPHGLSDVKISHPEARTTTAQLLGGKDSARETENFGIMQGRFKAKWGMDDFDWNSMPVTSLEAIRHGK